MFGGKLLFLTLLLFCINGRAKKAAIQPCDRTSSCGNIPNITHPFRLKGDPENCGDKKYELACEDDRTVLYLFPGKYYVQAINYNNYTIRVVDVGIQKDNCSSLPFHSPTWDNVPREYGGPYTPLYYTEFEGVVVFMNCDNPVNSPLYMNISGSCIKEEANYAPNSSLSSSGKGHSYVMAGNVNVSDVADLCRVEMVVMITPALLPGGGGGNFSFLDVHNALAYGFEISWRFGIAYGRFCPRDWSSFHCTMYRIGIWLYIVLVYAGLGLAARGLCGILCLLVFLIYKFRRRHFSMFDGIESYLQSQNNLMPIRYSYTDINTMTIGFRDKLGEGGYGCVYKGKLRSGLDVAVKILGKSKANGQEFINEVATIGRIHHVNVVRLIGYCVERSKRALVYAFMPNGSLEKYIFFQERNIFLSCEQMYEVSLGVARGIEYLHRGCDIQILHFDIKPHNILLDEDFTPKVSDFGLAKLYSTDESIVSLTAARGTMGYMAPELFYKNIGGVSYKADVYSFGMLLLEMAGRRKNLNAFADHTSQIYFPSWVYDQFKEGRDIEIGETSEEGRVMVKKMIIVALWCIQMNPSERPSMSKVVEMLEGNVELLQMPPKPFLCPQDQMPAEDHGIDSSPTEPSLRPRDMPADENHGINMNPTELPMVSGDGINSITADVSPY